MHITPSDLDWGVVPVLTSIPKVITLSNESLIPARFTANMVGKTSKTKQMIIYRYIKNVLPVPVD